MTRRDFQPGREPEPGLPPAPSPPGGLAIPPGTFRIDRDGVWYHEGHEITHPGVLQNLYANLRVDAAGHFLQVGPGRIPVEVEDAPFVVYRVEPSVEEPGAPLTLCVHLSDGSSEGLDPVSAWISARQTPYCRVKAGRFAARFSVSAWLQLARFVEEAPGTGELILVLGSQRVRLARQHA